MAVVLPSLSVRMTSPEWPYKAGLLHGPTSLVVHNTFLELVDLEDLDLSRLRRCSSEPAVRIRSHTMQAKRHSAPTAPNVKPADRVLDVRSVVPHRTPARARDPAMSEAVFKQDHLSRTQKKTTVMLRNLPFDVTRDVLLSMLHVEGLDGKFDFVYAPMDFDTERGLGYAFVNATGPEGVQQLFHVFQGRSMWPVRCPPKVCRAMMSTRQGLESNVAYFRNSSVMDPCVPERYKPALFEHGQQVEFPSSTRRVSRVIFCPRDRIKKR